MTMGNLKLAPNTPVGDDTALEALMRAHHDRVYRFGLRACRDGFDADDAVQEAFIKLAGRPEVSRDPSVLSWLMSVVRNACFRMLRPYARERRHLGERIDPQSEVDGGTLNAELSLLRFELVGAVHEAIGRLEQPYREVLVLRDIEGRSGVATCEALGIQPATMKTRLHRARSQLRAELHRRRLAPVDPERQVRSTLSGG